MGGPESLSTCSLENGHVPFHNMKMKNVNVWWVLATEKRYVSQGENGNSSISWIFFNEIRSDYHHPLIEELKTRLLSIINHSSSSVNYQSPITNGEWCSDIPVYRYRFTGNPNLGRSVPGCIEADFYSWRLIFQDLPSFTKPKPKQNGGRPEVRLEVRASVWSHREVGAVERGALRWLQLLCFWRGQWGA